MKQRRILVVDDEPGIRQSLSGILEDDGYAVEAVESGEACLAALPGAGFELVLLDIWLPGVDGMEVLARIQEIPFGERPVVVVISGHGSIEAAVKATKLGAFDFLEKPLSIQKVTVVVKNGLERRSLSIENSRLKGDSGARWRIIGESVPMKALRQQLTLMAGTNGRVLIYGESGTGKELVAHALHQLSPRAAEPFVEVNCAAIPEELIESELFGHNKGSFAGAQEAKIGKFQKAYPRKRYPAFPADALGPVARLGQGRQEIHPADQCARGNGAGKTGLQERDEAAALPDPGGRLL